MKSQSFKKLNEVYLGHQTIKITSLKEWKTIIYETSAVR